MPPPASSPRRAAPRRAPCRRRKGRALGTFVFHPNGRWFYSINEEASTLAFMHYEAGTGTLTPQHEQSTLPPRFAGTCFAADIVMSPNGRQLYCLNRLHDSSLVHAARTACLAAALSTRGHGAVDPLPTRADLAAAG